MRSRSLRRYNTQVHINNRLKLVRETPGRDIEYLASKPNILSKSKPFSCPTGQSKCHGCSWGVTPPRTKDTDYFLREGGFWDEDKPLEYWEEIDN